MEQQNQVKLNLNSSSEVLTFNYKWHIPHFRSNQIYSEKLQLKDDISCTIMLVPQIVHQFNNNNDNRWFGRSFFMVFFTKVPEDGKTWFNFNVREHFKRRPVSTASFRKVMMSIDGFRGNLNNLNSTTWKHFIQKDNSLNLDVSFILDDFSCKSFNMENFEKKRSKLSQDFAVLYKDPKFLDMKLTCANHEDINANRAILAARSPVFAKMLSSDTEFDPFLTDEDFSKEVVAEFLRFIYTDTISIDKFDANTSELLKMAKKYEVPELANLCQQDLIHGCKDKMDEIFKKFKNLSCQNISEINNFAEISRCVKDLYKASKNIN